MSQTIEMLPKHQKTIDYTKLDCVIPQVFLELIFLQ